MPSRELYVDAVLALTNWETLTFSKPDFLRRDQRRLTLAYEPRPRKD